jgi:hypothetical protein
MLSVDFGTNLTGRHITKGLFPFSYNDFLKIWYFSDGNTEYDFVF